MLRGSRVRVLLLSPAHSTDPDVFPIGGHLVPSVYRAFAYLSRSSLQLPSIVAPLGPVEYPLLIEFWRGFYEALGETLRIEEAMAQGRIRLIPFGVEVPTALFMRQTHEHLFRRLPPMGRSIEEDPTQVQVQLELSQELVARLTAIGAHYGEQDENVSAFIDQESTRQESFTVELDPWLQPPEDEQ
jgi:hypothetical protein